MGTVICCVPLPLRFIPLEHLLRYAQPARLKTDKLNYNYLKEFRKLLPVLGSAGTDG